MSKQSIQGVQLSPQQRRVWRLQESTKPHPYIAACVVLIEGELDRRLLRAALEQIVQRHEILRTTFQCLPGMTIPLQVINQEAELVLHEYDLGGCPQEEQEARVASILLEARAAWDFERGPLLRLSLIGLGANKHELIISTTALYADRAGLKNLVAEIQHCYAAKLHGQALDDAPLQYADVADLYNELLEAESTAAGREYWQKYDLSVVNSLKLFHDRQAGVEESFAPEVLGVAIDAELTNRLEELAGRSDMSLSVLLLACWQLLLCRLSGQSRMIVGTIVDGRGYEEIETALGLYARCLPVQCELTGGLRFVDLVQQVGGAYHDVNIWQESFTWEQATGKLESVPAPFFPYCFDYAVVNTAQTESLTFSISDQYVCTERFQVRLSCVRSGERLRAEFHYDSGRYEAGAMARLAEEYLTLLESVVQQAESRVAELAIVGESERRQLAAWNETRREYEQVASIAAWFEREAAQRPEAVAVVCEGEQLCYGELNRRGNQLGHYLRGLGVGPEVLVGLYLERSVAAVVGLLGIMKAGGAYVPLEPEHPVARVSYVLADTGAPVLVTEERLRERLTGYAGRVVSLDREWSEIARESEGAVASGVQGANLAYVIYTSGSTGSPKGVAVEQRQLVNYVAAVQEALGVERGASYAVVTTLAADLGHTMVYGALCSGGVLHVVRAERGGDGARWSEYCEREQIAVLKLAPSHLRGLLAGGGGAGMWPRQRLVLGGEATSWELAAQVRERLPAGSQLLNHYGPTETTVGVLTYGWDGERVGGAEGETLPLGRPLGNTRVYVLDEQQGVVPVGVVGEICIGGAGVSRGYWRQAGETAGRYLPDELSGVAGARLYRTGDQGRYLSDGRVSFVGRRDGQVKVRGYRVELGEVAAALRAHAGVREAVVTVRGEEAGEARLVGYVVGKREYLEVIGGRRRQRLPNGLAIVQQNRHETEYLYREIFEEEVYFQHGIEMGAEGCVFDVGANIGMFSLQVRQRSAGARVYAFEPLAEVSAALRLNAELYGGGRVQVYGCGLGAVEEEVEFNYYAGQTMMSGLSAYADAEYETEVVAQTLRNEQARGVAVLEWETAAGLWRQRLAAQRERCRLRPLSAVLRETGEACIDLLKVDVQRAEMDVLAGIAAADWEKIGQIVMEVHDREGSREAGRLGVMRELLAGKGYEVVTEQEAGLAGTDRYNLYARRPGWWRGRTPAVARAAAVAAAVEERLWNGASANRELRQYLRERLPEYMVPSWVVLLEALPLTANGKVDGAALPAPEQSGGVAQREWRTPVEEMVAGVWSEILKAAAGPESNFFELGGHSLLATQVVSRLREALGVEVQLRELFEWPTVRGLAAWLETASQAQQGLSTPPLERVERSAEMPLSFAQQRLWFLDQLESGNSFYNVSAAVRLTGPLNVKALEQTLSEIIRRHEVLHTSFAEVDGLPIQIINPADDFKLTIRNLDHYSDAEREVEVINLAREEAEQPFDLSSGKPLLRASLLKLETAEHVLLFTMHHIVSDGWSIGILLREIATLYEAYSQGRSSPLPELPIQYADFAVWQRNWLTGEVLDKQLEYWKKQLKAMTKVLELPADRVRPVVQTFRGAHHAFSLPLELSSRLQELSRSEDVTLFMTLLAAWQILLYRYTNQEQISVGTPIANRNRVETEMLIGFFVNTLVMNTDLSANPGFGEVLKRVREVCLGAYAHQDVPFEKLVEVLQPERSLSLTPLIQTWFAFGNAPESKLQLAGLSLSTLKLESGTAKFDLGLNMSNTAQGLIGTLEYKTDLFSPTTTKRVLRQFEALLQHIVTHPNEKLSALTDMLVKADKQIQREELQVSKEANLALLKATRKRSMTTTQV